MHSGISLTLLASALALARPCSAQGFVTRTVTVKNGDELNIALVPDNFKLDEVVITGQGAAVQKRRLSTNVSTVGSKVLEGTHVDRIDQMLQDAVPNMQINLASGQAGTTSLFKSRGLSSAFTNSTPVIYVDGVRVDNLNTGATLNNSLSGNSAVSGSLSDIPADNIDHVEYVSGGAATTLYGSDAANGVIQIFRRSGQSPCLTSLSFMRTSCSCDLSGHLGRRQIWIS